MPGRRALAPPGCRSPAAAICGQVLDSSSVNKLVASLTPGTCRGRLWLLPSGPDQVHQTAMRGGPPPPLYVIAVASQAAVSGQSGPGMRSRLMYTGRILLHRAKTRWLTRPGLQSRRAFSFVHWPDEDQRSARGLALRRVRPGLPGRGPERLFGRDLGDRCRGARGFPRLRVVLDLSRGRRRRVRRALLDDPE